MTQDGVCVAFTAAGPERTPATARRTPALSASRAGTRLLCAAFLVLVFASCAWAIEIRQTVWGFDGQYVPERFNIVSVFVDNPSQSPFDGQLVLTRCDPVGRKIGEDFIEPCFLSPNAGRWIQFCVFMPVNADTWRLSWDPGKSVMLPAPRSGALARVMLADSDLASESSGGIRRFPDQLFPVSITATQTLDSVVLSYMPKWEASRRRAFMDWLACGGTVHLLLGPGGASPVFTHELEPLNNSNMRFRVGTGLAVRHAASRRDCDHGYLAAQGFPAQPEYKPVETQFRNTEDFIFSRLSQLTHARHNWTLIYVVIVVYVIVLAPVNFFVARLRNWQTTWIFFLSTVALFTVLIAFIGRRGTGEASAVNTISYARSLGGGAWDATQWTNVFVVAGKVYTVAHRTGNDLYSTCQEFESIQGYAHNGAEGHLVVEMPLYSNRAFQHRARMKAPNVSFSLTGMRVEATPQREDVVESVSFTGTLPEGFKTAWVSYRDRVYGLMWENGALRLGPGTGVALSDFAESGHGMGDPWGEREKVDVERTFGILPPRLIRRAVGGVEASRTAFCRPDPKAAVHLFVFARAPESFLLSASPFGKETGYVLYHLIFFKTGDHSWGTLNVQPQGRG